MLKEVIRWVNTKKQISGSTEHNVVLGLSMGGLVARYALKTMENAGENHDTRLFVCHDSPQQGANVPTGLQFAVNHFTNLYLRSGVGFLAYNFLGIMPALFRTGSRPASLQMTINYIDQNDNLNNSVHNAWQAELTNLGYPDPANCRNVVISNGSECGKLQDVIQGGELFLVDGQFKTSLLTELIAGTSSVLFPKVTFDVFAGLAVATGQPALLLGILPGSNKINLHFQTNAANTMGGNQVYNGNMTFTKKLLWLVPITVTMTNRSRNAPSVLNYDIFPGGVSHSDPISGTAANTWFYDYHFTVHGPVDFCFIPTPSALDLGANPSALAEADYLIPYGPANAPVAPKNTPFVNFITARNGAPNNEHHISYETRNGNWFATELNASSPVPANYNIVDCSLACSSGIITGPDYFCGTDIVQFTVPGLLPNANVTWSASGQIFISGPTTGSQVNIGTTVAYGVSGYGALYATLHSTCGDILITKYVYPGTKPLPPIDGPTEVTAFSFNMYTIYAPEATSDPYWQMAPGPLGYSPGYGTTYNMNSGPAGSYLLYVTVPTACGPEYQSIWITVDDDNGGFGTFAAFPNPTGSSMTITSTAKTNNGTKPHKKPFVYKIYDRKGKLIKQGETKTGDDLDVDVRDIPSDNYFLHIIDGKNIIKKQIIIQH